MARPKKDGAATSNKYTCTNCLYQVLWVASWRTRTRHAAAKPSYPTGASSSTLGVPFRAFFFLIFLIISMVIFISPVNFIFFVLKLIDWLFTFANLFQMLNIFSDIFSWQINFFCPLSLVCLSASVVKKKKNLNLSVKKRFYLVKVAAKTR